MPGYSANCLHPDCSPRPCPQAWARVAQGRAIRDRRVGVVPEGLGWLVGTAGIPVKDFPHTPSCATAPTLTGRQFWYVDRLKSEIATYPDGRADIHEHPLEPIMARFTISKAFGGLRLRTEPNS